MPKSRPRRGLPLDVPMSGLPPYQLPESARSGPPPEWPPFDLPESARDLLGRRAGGLVRGYVVSHLAARGEPPQVGEPGSARPGADLKAGGPAKPELPRSGFEILDSPDGQSPRHRRPGPAVVGGGLPINGVA
jgi:hypothetical protein